MDFPNKQQFIDSIHKCLELAVQKYTLPALTPSEVKIIFKPNGQSIGVAGKRAGFYYLKFSIEAIGINFDDMIKNTIPHEVAHLVCFENPKLGDHHDDGWKRVCRALGGDDSRTHDYQVTRAKEKTMTRYVYQVDGREIEFGHKHHAIIRKNWASGSIFNIKLNGKAQKHTVFPSMCIGKREYRREPITNAWIPASIVKDIIAQSASGQLNKVAGESKRDACIRIFNANPTLARKDVIQLFCDNIGMTPAGAGTYYHNIKSGQWS